MSVQVDQISAFQKRLQFTIPGAEVSKKLDEAFRTLAHRVRLPGFRPGKAPRRILEARFGKQLRQEVASDLINFKFREAAQDLVFLGQPEVDKADIHDGQDFTFAITVQVKPEIAVEGYQGIKVDYPVAEVDEGAVEALVQRRLAGQSRLVVVEEDREVRAGDVVMAEVVALLDDGERVIEQGTMLNATQDRYYPGAEALVRGLKKGGSATGKVTIGDSNSLPEKKGQSVEVRVTVSEIQASEVPELTDAIAAELGYEGGVAGMRGALRMEEEGRANEAARNVARVNLLRALIDANPIDVPPAMVDSHVGLLKEELRIQAAYRGRDPRSIRYSDAEEADLRERGLFAARSALLLEAVSRLESIAVTDDDLEAKYQEIADLRGQRVEAIRGYFKKDNAVEELRKRLLEERTLEWLLEQAELNYTGGAAAAEAAPAAEAPAKAKKPRAKKAAAEEAPAIEAAPEAAPAAEEAPAAKAKKPRATKAKAKTDDAAE